MAPLPQTTTTTTGGEMCTCKCTCTAKKSKVRQNEKEKAHLLQQRPSITDLHGRRVEHIESRGAVTVAAVIVPMPIGLPELTLLTSAHCVLCFVAVKIKPRERERKQEKIERGGRPHAPRQQHSNRRQSSQIEVTERVTSLPLCTSSSSPTVNKLTF